MATRARNTITRDTPVSMALVFMAMGALVSGVWWASTITHRLDEIEQAVRYGGDDRWKGADMRAWVHAFDDAVEVWSLQLERQLPLDPSRPSLQRFQAPDPDMIRGR